MTGQPLYASANAVFRLVYHLVLTTKYRRRVLTGPMLARVSEIARATCEAWQGRCVECSGESDHVHLLLEAPPKVRPADLVNILKTRTSRLLRSEFPALRAAYRKPVLWSPSYCLLSAGGAPIEILKRYIENQDRPA